MPGGSFESPVIEVFKISDFRFQIGLSVLISVFPRFYRSVQDGNQKSSILNLKSLGIKKPAPFLVAGCRNRFALAFVQLVSAGNRFNGPPPMWW
jgi:hypothetical protein